METNEKIPIILQHWIEHNQSHAEEYRKWQAVTENAELAAAIAEAAAAMIAVNECLRQALALAGGEVAASGDACHHGHHEQHGHHHGCGGHEHGHHHHGCGGHEHGHHHGCGGHEHGHHHHHTCGGHKHGHHHHDD